ncbi:MAG: type II secretion system protein J, partial [Chloroflexota bacterium]
MIAARTVARRGLTLVELLVSIAVTALVAASVASTVSAVGVGLRGQDDSAQEVARLARAQARIADHLYRARMILSQSATVATLWVPSEEFDGSADNAARYDAIHGRELRWYVVDRANGTILAQRLSDQANASEYPLSTDWSALRSSLAAPGALASAPVVDGVLEGAFRFASFSPCD